MSTIGQTGYAFETAKSNIVLQKSVPAAFASSASPVTSDSYVFIDTSQLVEALRDHGFHPTLARQTNTRSADPRFAKHMVRFRHLRESVTLVDAVPELILINAHDGTSAYVLSAGLYRPICENGMMTCLGDFDFIRVPHRGNVVANVVDGAIRISQRFEDLGRAVEQMARRELSLLERQHFAEQAMRVRYRDAQHLPYRPDALLHVQRTQHMGNDLWHVYNVVQERLTRGGVVSHSPTGRLSRTRPIRAIREDVRINTALWQVAMQMIRS